MKRPFALMSLCLVACAGTVKPLDPPRAASTSLRFSRVGIHFLVVPVRIDDRIDAKFILDTGIGVNIISQALCKQIGCVVTGRSSGRRMSGQRVEFPMSTVGALSVGDKREAGAKVAVFDFEDRNFGVDPSISGFLSLDFFRDRAFTLDYAAGSLVLEDEASLRSRRARGTVVPLRVERENEAIDVFIPMRLADGTTASIELDTGSPALTLDERFMAQLSLAKRAPQVKEVTGSDETGYVYQRYFATDPQPIGIDAAHMVPVRTMFQKIIHDGLLGDAYLKQFIVTFDLPRSEMIFASPTPR